jgi:hypothetical protein
MAPKDDIERFKLEVTRRRLNYLKDIRTRGHDVDEGEIARLEAEVAAEEARLRERLAARVKRNQSR